MYTIENLKKKSNSYYEDEDGFNFYMNNKIIISVNKNESNNIFRNQNDQIFTISEDGGETWKTILTNNPNLHPEEIPSNEFIELINFFKEQIKQIEYELENIDYKINNIINLYENIKKEDKIQKCQPKYQIQNTL